jgi:hypothetical protein
MINFISIAHQVIKCAFISLTSSDPKGDELISAANGKVTSTVLA